MAEGEKGDRQEESEEVKGRSQVEETTSNSFRKQINKFIYEPLELCKPSRNPNEQVPANIVEETLLPIILTKSRCPDEVDLTSDDARGRERSTASNVTLPPYRLDLHKNKTCGTSQSEPTCFVSV